MRSEKILAIVLAGGEGSRLRPLTLNHAKPAIPFGGSFRLVDFVLSNLVNSGIHAIYLLAQYKPKSLIEHVHANWSFGGNDLERFVSVALPRADQGESYRGTADAVYKNLDLIRRHKPDLVAVFAADHVYRMDVRQMVRFHRESGSHATVAATPVPLERATAFGVIATGANGEIWDFQEKPQRPIAIPGDDERAYASMGNYLFDADVLVDALENAIADGKTDFGQHILPRLIHTHRVYAYDFADNEVPGVQPYEERAYWRDVGTLDAYAAAQQDALGSMPRFNLHNADWPMLPHLVLQGPAEASQIRARREPAYAQPFAVNDMLIPEFAVLQEVSPS